MAGYTKRWRVGRWPAWRGASTRAGCTHASFDSSTSTAAIWDRRGEIEDRVTGSALMHGDNKYDRLSSAKTRAPSEPLSPLGHLQFCGCAATPLFAPK